MAEPQALARRGPQAKAGIGMLARALQIPGDPMQLGPKLDAKVQTLGRGWIGGLAIGDRGGGARYWRVQAGPSGWGATQCRVGLGNAGKPKRLLQAHRALPTRGSILPRFAGEGPCAEVRETRSGQQEEGGGEEGGEGGAAEGGDGRPRGDQSG